MTRIWKNLEDSGWRRRVIISFFKMISLYHTMIIHFGRRYMSTDEPKSELGNTNESKTGYRWFKGTQNSSVVSRRLLSRIPDLLSRERNFWQRTAQIGPLGRSKIDRGGPVSPEAGPSVHLDQLRGCSAAMP